MCATNYVLARTGNAVGKAQALSVDRGTFIKS